MTNPRTIQSAIATIKSMPRIRGGKAIHWAANIDATAHVAAVILSASDCKKAMLEIVTGSGAPVHAIDNLIHGRASGGGHWAPLREALAKMSVAWLTDRLDEKNAARAAKANPIAPPAATSALPVTPATFSVVPQESNGTYRVDADSQDIFVMTTTRLRYGTPEHRAKLHEVMLSLGVRK